MVQAYLGGNAALAEGIPISHMLSAVAWGVTMPNAQIAQPAEM